MALVRNDPAGAQGHVCDLCQHIRVIHQKPSKERLIDIMHSSCPDCLSSKDSGQHLCSLCQHWRFQHVFNCLFKPDTHQDRKIPKRIIFVVNAIRNEYEYNLSKRCVIGDIIYRALELDPEFLRRTKLETFDDDPLLLVSLVKDPGFIGVSTHGSLIWLYPPAEVPNRVQPEIQWSLINNWLSKCTEKHEKCHGQYFKQPDEIRLIDVQRRKLVRVNENSRFVALSYVWGTSRISERLTCLKSNAEELEQDDALKAEKLPQTIEDALQVCNNLGEKYLWVDRLCIVQDDSSQKHGQIEAMAKIFASAFLVIVVLDGDMETGIPGIQLRPQTQKRVEIDGVVCMTRLPGAYDLINNSNWATRGWTYQEAILARRKLYFSWVQIFLQCNTDIEVEDATVWSKKGLENDSFLTEHGWSLDKWHQHLSTYTVRSLSYQSDIYNAIAGISNALLPEPASWLYGLPRRDFDEALLWFNDLKQGWRVSDEVVLPRWSWTSVKGKIWQQTGKDPASGDAIVGADPAVFTGTVVAWNYQEQHGASLRYVPVRDSKSVAYVRPRISRHSQLIYSEKDPSRLQITSIRFPYRSIADGQMTYGASRLDSSPKLLCFAIGWSQGCIDVDWPFPAISERTFRELGADLEQQWQEPDYLERDIVFSYSQEQEIPISELETRLHRGTLKGRTQTSFFSLEETEIYPGQRTFTIIDNKDRAVGQIEGIEEEKANIPLQSEESCIHELIALAIGFFEGPQNIDAMYGNFLSDDPVAESWWHEVVEIDCMPDPLTQEQISLFCETMGPNGLDISYLDSEGSALSFIPVVRVMLAEWDGPVARRISIGWVFLTKWVQSAPKFKTVYLA